MAQVKEFFVNLSENFKSFIIDNNANPVLWISLLFIGILLFAFTYNALNKNK